MNNIPIPEMTFGDIIDDIPSPTTDTDPFPPPFIDNSNNDISSNTVPPLDISGISIPIDNSNNIIDTDSDNDNIRIRPVNNNTLCCVCLQFHSFRKMVQTPCKHDICNKCFFRWIKINPNCPYCRNNFTSWENMADDEINDDIYAVTHLFETVCNQHNKLLKKNVNLKKDNQCLLIDNQNFINKNKKLFESNIRLNKLIDYTKGYYHSLMDGYKSHIINKFYDSNSFLVKLFVTNDDCYNHNLINKQGYQNGYNCGYKDFHKHIKSEKKKFKTISSQTSLINSDDDLDEWSSSSFLLSSSSSSNDS